MDIQKRNNDKEIYAPLKSKWLVMKPEEEVRQKYICRLVDSYGYSLDQMDQEIQVSNSQRGQGAARADIVVWRSKEDKESKKYPLIVVECKAESVTIRKEDYYQGMNYASWAHADFFVTTNLKETRIFRIVKGQIPDKLDEIVYIPNDAVLVQQDRRFFTFKIGLKYGVTKIPISWDFKSRDYHKSGVLTIVVNPQFEERVRIKKVNNSYGTKQSEVIIEPKIVENND